MFSIKPFARIFESVFRFWGLFFECRKQRSSLFYRRVVSSGVSEASLTASFFKRLQGVIDGFFGTVDLGLYEFLGLVFELDRSPIRRVSLRSNRISGVGDRSEHFYIEVYCFANFHRNTPGIGLC